MSKPKAEFLGLYEADENQVYRVLISDCESFGEAHFSISNSQDVDINILTINSPTGDLAPFTFELSIRVPRGFNKFSLLYRGARIASMNKIKAARLMIKRNIAMVNPAIDERYQEWLKLNPINIPVPDHGPLISIICPLFNTPIPYLREMIDSVLDQTYRNWELVLVNASPDNIGMKQVLATYKDGRIKVIELEDNLGIVGNTNIGISHTTGDYIAFLDHDDTVDRNLLSAYVNRIIEHPETDLFYCDEDNFCESLDDAYGPRFKPDFNLDLLYSHNYVLHCLMVSRHALNQIELSPEYVNGAQDYDLTLKTVEVARSIYHAPYILYHWRAHAGSTNGGEVAVKPYAIEAGRHALQDHFDRRGIDLTSKASEIPCVYELHCDGERTVPATIVIKYKNLRNLTTCLESMTHQTFTNGDKILAVGPQVDELSFESKKLPPITVVANASTNHCESVEGVLRRLDTPIAIFCTDEILFNQADCLNGIIGMASRREISIASPKLLYLDGLVAQAGRYILDNGRVVYINRYFTDHMGGGYHGLAECACNYSAASPNCFGVETKQAIQAIRQTRSLVFEEIINHIAASNHENKLLTVVNPLYKAAIAPYPADDQASQSIIGVKEVLLNRNVEVTSGYMRLNIEKDDERDARRQFASRLKAHVLR